MANIKEKDIEEAIQNSLISSGFAQSVSSDFDRKNCINKVELFRFLEATQSDLVEEFKKFRPTNWEEKLLDMIDTNIKQKGLIRVLREGVEDYSLSSNLRLVYLKPNLLDKTHKMPKNNLNLIEVIEVN